MKNGFTLIELIFTIVILAITTMAIPRMVAQTAEINVFAIKQELVMNAKTIMTQISKVPWDSAYKFVACSDPADTNADKTAKANACLSSTYIHEIPGGNNILNLRAGILDNVEARKKAVADAAAPVGGSSFGPGALNDIDDYNGYATNMVPIVDVAGGNTSGDYLLNTGIATVVGFVSDDLTDGNYANSDTISANLATATVANPTNIKMIQITATDNADPARSVVLRTYSFNIGAGNIQDTTLE